MKTSHRLKLATAALGFSYGCATLPPDASVAFMDGNLPPSSGVVIAEVFNNGSRITGHVDHWEEVVLWRQNYEGEDRTYWMSALDQSHSTQIYVGAIPAGTYRIGVLHTRKVVGDTTYFARALIPPAMGTFEVLPGQVTNLGTIVYHPFQAKHRAEESYPDYAVTRFSNNDLLRLADTLYPEVMAQVDRALPVSGWLEDSYVGVRNQTAKLIKDAALPTDMRPLRNGSYLLTGLNGALYSLEDGQWRNRSLAHHYKITGLVELPSGELLIGSEFGKLSIGQLEGTFCDLSMDDKPRHVIDVVLSKGGGAYLVSDVMDSYEVHHFSPESRSTSWLKTLPKLTEGFLQVGLSRPAVISTAYGIAVYIDQQVHRYNEAAGSWSVAEAEEFSTLHEQLNGTIAGIPYSAWTGTKPLRYSEDGGRTWSAVREEGNIFIGPVKRPSYRFTDGEIIRPGEDQHFHWLRLDYEVSDSAPVLSTMDDGISWTTVGSVPPGCADIAVEASHDDGVYILCEDGRLLVSDDRGRNWGEAQGVRAVPGFVDFPAELKVRFSQDDEMGEHRPVYVPPVLLQ